MAYDLVSGLAKQRLDEALRAVATFGALAGGRDPAALAKERRDAGFSLAHLIGVCASGRGVVAGELEYEACAEAAELAKRAHDAQRPLVPWRALARRDLTTATPGGGGYLVNTAVGDAVDVLRPWSVAARAGVSILSGLQSNLSIPRTTGNVTGYWLPDEGTPTTESTPTLGSVAMTPKTCGAYLEISRQLRLQSPQVETFVRNELLRTIGTLVDTAILNGSGTLGQPLGLLNTAGIGTQSGTAIGYSDILAMQDAVAAANADDASVSAIATPAVRALLAGRERAAGSGMCWDRGELAGMRGYATTAIPDGTLIVGAWPEVVLGLWGPGFELAISPLDPEAFRRGVVGVRMLVSVDVAVRHPSAFCVASSIT